jgi:hypothetical protein
VSEGAGRRWLIVGLAGLVVVAAAVVVVLVVVNDGGDAGTPIPAKGTSTRPSADPSGLPAPDAELAARTLDYLAGAGAPAMTMHRAAVGLGAKPTAERCRQVGATLDRDAPPDQLVLVIEAVPDDVLRGALGDERTSLGATLTACVAGRAMDDERVTPLAESTGRVQQRLDELEAAR